MTTSGRQPMLAAMPTCPVCNKQEAKLLTQGEDYEYHSLPDTFSMWQCQSCSHGYLDPMPAPEQLGTIYPPTYYTVNPESPMHFKGFIFRTKMKRDVGRIVELVKERKVRSVVDLGCGDAERLAQVGEALRQERGHDVECIGVDLQPDAKRSEALAQRGVKLVQDNIEEGLEVLTDNGHDLIIMCQIFEHLRDPRSVMQTLARKLAPGGMVMNETPNLGGIDYFCFGRKWWGGYHIPRHFHLFTVGSLTRVTEDAGLRIYRKGFIPSGFSIVSTRNMFGLTSIKRSRHWMEWVNIQNLFVVGFLTALDLFWIKIGRQTSNQFMLAEKI